MYCNLNNCIRTKIHQFRTTLAFAINLACGKKKYFNAFYMLSKPFDIVIANYFPIALIKGFIHSRNLANTYTGGTKIRNAGSLLQ